MIRPAQFAHSWYPGDTGSLRDLLARYVGEARTAQRATAVVAPHAGYRFSGPIAGEVFGRVVVPEHVIVLCVNHRGIGEPAAVYPSGSWETPLGAAPIDEPLTTRLLDRTPLLRPDARAHAREHSLEMQVPFLQYRNPAVRLVAVCLHQLTYAQCEELGRGLAETVREQSGNVLLVASTDMTHFESGEAARTQDMLAIERILEMDPAGLYRTVRERRISMCGYIPTTTVLCACLELGCTQAELVRYGSSGDATGDYAEVVGYAGLLIR